jgi:hypothetical protein
LTLAQEFVGFRYNMTEITEHALAGLQAEALKKLI